MPTLSAADHATSPPSITIPRQYNAADDLIGRNLVAGRGAKTAYIDDAGSYSYDELARRVARTSEVRWLQDGVRHVHATEDATAFVRDLLVTHTDGIAELQVTRADLEDTYLAMVHASGATREEGEPR